MKIKTQNKRKSTYKEKKINYVTDIKGIRKSVILPINRYEELLEDLHDLSVVASRKKDSIRSYNNFLKELEKDGLL